MRTNINNVEEVIRSFLVQQSKLDEQYVRNALSIYGSYADQSYNGIDWSSIETTQSLIFFELANRSNDSDVSEMNSEGIIKIYTSYQVHVIIYGDDSKNLANTLIARLRSARCRDLLLEQDIYLERVSNSDSVNDFKNGVLWQRNDFDIDIICEIDVEPAIEDYIFDEYSDIIIKTKEMAEDDIQ